MADDDDDDDDNEIDDDDDLQFSDHVGLFENTTGTTAPGSVDSDGVPIDQSAASNEDVDDDIDGSISKHYANCDFYKLAKTNYKLTFNRNDSTTVNDVMATSNSTSKKRSKKMNRQHLLASTTATKPTSSSTVVAATAMAPFDASRSSNSVKYGAKMTPTCGFNQHTSTNRNTTGMMISN